MSFVSWNVAGGKFLFGFGGFVFVGTMATSAFAAEAATTEIAFCQDHKPVLVIEILALDEGLLYGVSHDGSLAGPES